MPIVKVLIWVLFMNIIFCCSRHVAILEIREKGGFRMTKVKLETVRPFYIEDVVLSNTDIDPTQEERVMAYLVEKVSHIKSVC